MDDRDAKEAGTRRLEQRLPKPAAIAAESLSESFAARFAETLDGNSEYRVGPSSRPRGRSGDLVEPALLAEHLADRAGG